MAGANSITKEEFVDYYITTNHTRKETQSHFGISKSGIDKLMKQFNVRKGKFETYAQLKARVTKEKIEQYYMVENHSVGETLQYFHLNSTSMRKLLREYGLCKIKNKHMFKDVLAQVDGDEFQEYYNTHTLIETSEHYGVSQDNIIKLVKTYNVQKRGEYIRDVAKRIGRDDLYNYYVVQQHTQKETQSHFGITEYQLVGLIRYFDLFKKDKIEDVLQRVPREELYQYYIVENRSPYELAEHYNISSDMCYGLIRHYDLAGLRVDSMTRLTNRVPKDELVKFYIEDDHSGEETREHFGISKWEFTQLLRLYEIIGKSGTSRYEEKVISHIAPDVKVERKVRRVLGNGKEIDIYLPEYNIGIEFNGTYWHCSLQKEKNYHFEKSKLAEGKGVRLIHIYEHEWNDPAMQEKIISLINIATHHLKTRIYARQCEVREITNSEAKLFNEANHLQGHRNAQVTYGLFYGGELVQLMSFSKTRYNKNNVGENDWEIIRGCPGSNNIVVGGVGKLFKHFIREHNPDHVFSYCDFNKFDGKGYEAIGMKFVGYTGPNLWWVLNLEPDVVVPRSPSKHKEMKEQSVAQLWGAGSKKYVWSKETPVA